MENAENVWIGLMSYQRGLSSMTNSVTSQYDVDSRMQINKRPRIKIENENHSEMLIDKGTCCRDMSAEILIISLSSYSCVCPTQTATVSLCRDCMKYLEELKAWKEFIAWVEARCQRRSWLLVKDSGILRDTCQSQKFE